MALDDELFYCTQLYYVIYIISTLLAVLSAQLHSYAEIMYFAFWLS